jgi:hypothetical protein
VTDREREKREAAAKRRVTTYDLTEAEREALEKRAASERRSVSFIVAEAVRRWLRLR